MKTRKELEEIQTRLEAQIKPLAEAVAETRKNYAEVLEQRDKLLLDLTVMKKQLEGYAKLKDALAELIPAGQLVGGSTLNIPVKNRDVVYDVEELTSETKGFDVKENEGKIIWALKKLGKPSRPSDISALLNEYPGKGIKEGSLGPTLKKLVDGQWILQEGERGGTTYRLPEHAKFEVEEKK